MAVQGGPPLTTPRVGGTSWAGAGPVPPPTPRWPGAWLGGNCCRVAAVLIRRTG